MRLKICSLFRSGHDGQVGPFSRLEVLASTRDLKSNEEDETKKLKYMNLGRCRGSSKSYLLSFIFLFNVVFLRAYRFAHYIHLQTTNINNYKNQETKPIIDDNDQYENPGNPNVVFLGLGVLQPHTFTNNDHQQKTKTNKSNKYFSN